MSRSILATLLLLAALPADAACPRGALTGEVTYVRDGDTIELGAMAIRFEGIAAPEWDTPTGEAATGALRAMILGKEVRCELTGKATYDRCVAVCYLADVDIEAELVRMGLARDCPRFSGGRHAETELQAGWRGATIGEVYALPGYCRLR